MGEEEMKKKLRRAHDRFTNADRRARGAYISGKLAQISKGWEVSNRYRDGQERGKTGGRLSMTTRPIANWGAFNSSPTRISPPEGTIGREEAGSHSPITPKKSRSC